MLPQHFTPSAMEIEASGKERKGREPGKSSHRWSPLIWALEMSRITSWKTEGNCKGISGREASLSKDKGVS